MSNTVNLFGASGHAKVIIDILNKNDIIINAIYDDDKDIMFLLENKVQAFSNEIENFRVPFIISIGNNKVREYLSKKLSAFSFTKAVHPLSVIDKTTEILEGTVIMADAVINSSVKIGKHCIINTSSVIEHDCLISDFVHISPNATLCGNVTIGKGTHVGAGAVIIQGITIGENVTIGAGSVIIKNVPDKSVVVGNPGRIIKKTK